MTPYLKKTFQLLSFYLGFILLCRFTHGHAMAGIIAVGCCVALMNKRGWAMFYFLMIPLLTSVSYIIMPRSPTFNIYCRIGTIVMTFFLLLSSRLARGRRTVPLLGLFAYLAAVLLSSMQGAYPLISYLKLLNFGAFVVGLYLGTANLQKHPEDVLLLRSTFMAFSIFLVIGSLLTLAVPSVAYATSVKTLLLEGDVAGANEVIASGNVMALFTGVTWHSQALAPMAALINGWLLCDMLFVEKRITKLHGLMLFIVPVLLFMTRSRAGFVSYVVSLLVIGLYVMPREQIPGRVRQKMMGALAVFAVLVLAGAGVAEARDRTISRWLRKSDDVEADARSFSEAMTTSRMGKVEEMMADFRSSPILGIGFQVTRDMKMRGWGNESLFSAPVEKGVLPLVVLSEAGVVGASVFVFFLLHFWMSCRRDRNFVLLGLFIILLSTNMAEATFFSPSGGGGVLWIIAVVGGFMIDVTVQEGRKLTQVFIDENIPVFNRQNNRLRA